MFFNKKTIQDGITLFFICWYIKTVAADSDKIIVLLKLFKGMNRYSKVLLELSSSVEKWCSIWSCSRGFVFQIYYNKVFKIFFDILPYVARMFSNSKNICFQSTQRFLCLPEFCDVILLFLCFSHLFLSLYLGRFIVDHSRMTHIDIGLCIFQMQLLWQLTEKIEKLNNFPLNALSCKYLFWNFIKAAWWLSFVKYFSVLVFLVRIFLNWSDITVKSWVAWGLFCSLKNLYSLPYITLV